MWGGDFDWWNFRPPRPTLIPRLGVEFGGHNLTSELQPNGDSDRKSKTLYWDALWSGWAYDWCNSQPASPTICVANFLPIFFNANPPNILVNLQLLWLHNAHQFKVLLHLLPFGWNLKWECWDPQFWGLWESVRALGFIPVERPPTTSQHQSIQPFQFGRNSNVKLWPPNSTPRLGG